MLPYVSVNAEHNWVCLGMETFFLHNLSINRVWGRVHCTRNSCLSILAKTPQFKVSSLPSSPWYARSPLQNGLPFCSEITWWNSFKHEVKQFCPKSASSYCVSWLSLLSSSRCTWMFLNWKTVHIKVFLCFFVCVLLQSPDFWF